MPKKITTEEFIAKARSKHGNRYDYSKVVYKKAKSEVEIICKIHGSFWQIPYSHLHGYGCPVCGGTQKSNTEEFIKKAKEKHGNRYDYSKVVYKNNRTKIKIICKEHGVFLSRPYDHLKGKGCPVCSGRETDSNIIFRKLAVISEIEPFSFQFIQEFTRLSYSHVVQLCNYHGVKIYKRVLIKETSLFNNTENTLSKLGIKCKIIRNARVLKPNKELNKLKALGEIDIYIPDLKLGFEFNGMWCHKEGENGMKPKVYHMEKYNTAKKQNIELYFIWEDEYSCEMDIDFWNEEIRKIICQKNSLLKNL